MPPPLEHIAGQASSIGFTGTIGDALVNLTASYPGMYRLIESFCYLAALIFVFVGIRKLALLSESRGRNGNETYWGVIAAMMIGAMMAYIPELMKTFSCTASLQSRHGNVFDYGDIRVNSSVNLQIGAVFDFVRFIGVITFIKGVMMLRQIAAGTAAQNITWASVKWTLIGGVACFNIIPLITVLSWTFGIPGVLEKLGIVGETGIAC